MRPVVTELMERVRVLADEVLFTSALEVDRTGVIPPTHWERLAAEGMYGLAAPPDAGGPGLDLPDIIESLEVMASGCLATTFTWIQHHGAVVALGATANAALRDAHLADAVAGRARFGVAFAGVIPDPPRMTAVRTDDGWRISGHAPFVSGWGVIHQLQMSAGDVDTGDIVGAIVEAVAQPGVEVQPQPLLAADATNTVSLHVADLHVPDSRIVSRVPRADFMANQLFGVRLNGTLPLGLVRRCARLLDEDGHVDAADRLRVRCDAVRERLDAGLADPPVLIEARADGAELALHAAAALVTAGGGPSLVRSSHAQRLAREAVFTLVAASRAELKRSLLERFIAT